MPSFQLSISPSRRAAARFISSVRRAIQRALVEEKERTGLTQSEIARRIGVHRSVINREFRGQKDLTLGRLAELAHAMGREPSFELKIPKDRSTANARHREMFSSSSSSASEVRPEAHAPRQSQVKAA